MVDDAKLVKDWLIEKHGKEEDNLDSIDLIANGVLSSIDVVDLMLFIEKITSNQIPATKLNMDNFRTLPSIVSIIREIRVPR